MKLKEIKNKILLLPTIMEISDELQIISDLMNIESNELIGNKIVFCTIVEAIELSHTDSGIFQLTKENEGEFIKFYNWLKIINFELELGLNNNLIENFNLTTNKISKLMLDSI